MLAEKPKQGSFEPVPEGQYTGICTRMVDLGTHTKETSYGIKTNRQIILAWEIQEHRVTVDGIDKPALHTERFTWSFHEKSNLRMKLESWRGKRFNDDDFSGPSAFNTRNLMGAPAMLQIVHNKNGEKVYANMQSIMKAPIKREDWPIAEGDTIYLDLRNFDQNEFDKLSEYWQGIIIQSPEYQAIFASSNNSMSVQDMNDEIPF